MLTCFAEQVFAFPVKF